MLFHLYLTFVKIGIFAFGGGYAVLPLLQDIIVRQNGWLNMGELTELVSLSQITPGPIAINAATFIGTKLGGTVGAIVATLGNITPQFILMMVLSTLIFSGRKLSFLDKILKGLKPAIVALIAVATIAMIKSSIFQDNWDFGQVDPLALVGFGLGLVFYARKKLTVIQLVILSSALGLGLYGLTLVF